MSSYQSRFGFPWILEAIDKYDRRIVKQKPVPAQVIEILKMPSLSPVGNQGPETVVNICDQKFYIRAVITREAKETLERENEDFTVADIKNKIIILKSFTVCFTADEDIKRCEFFLNVQHFSVLAMEIIPMDLLNCNMDPGVRKKIHDLWQNYMKDLEMSEISDMNLSDVSLTQLLIVASEEKFTALKSVAEHCLELNPFHTQDILEQAITKWTKKENTSRFSIPVNLLLIPPHEEAALEHMEEFKSDLQQYKTFDAPPGEISPQLYSTARSTLCEEPVDSINSQSRNPWNKLQSLCVATCSDSQPRTSPPVAEISGEEELVADPDSCTPDIFRSHQDETLCESAEEHVSVALSEGSSTPELPRMKILNLQKTNNSSSNSVVCEEQGLPHSSLRLVPLVEDSLGYPMHSSPQKVQISPILAHSPEGDSCSRNNLVDKSMNKAKYSLRTRNVLKRKYPVDESETSLSDFEEQIPVCLERKFSVPVDSPVPTDKLLKGKHPLEPVSDLLKERTEPFNKSTNKESVKTCRDYGTKKCIQSSKPSIDFSDEPRMLTKQALENRKIVSLADGATTDRPNLSETSSHAACEQSSSFQAKERNCTSVIQARKNKLTHYDGTPFQYKYKPPPPDLCLRVNSIRMPANLCEWAVTFLSEHKPNVP